jgi:cytoskeletal protein RodZ
MTNQRDVFSLAMLKRQAGRMSLQQIARDTRIGVRYLRAIEQGRLNDLPGGIYTISYIRQYAAAVGAEEWDLLNAYFSLADRGETGANARRRGFAARVRESVEEATNALRGVRFRFFHGEPGRR